jgi:hypothetical protein
MRRSWLIKAGILALIGAGAALAQVPGLFLSTLTGNEQVNVLVPSTGGVVTSPQVTSVRSSQLRDTAGYQKLVPTTGQTITAANNVSVIQLTPAGGLAALTINTPVSPWDGQRLQVFTTQTITTFNLTASGTQTVNGNLAGALAANGSVEYLYSASNTTWDRIQ